jgi:hypothetical protein
MSYKSIQWVPVSTERVNGRKDRKKCRRRDRYGKADSHFYKFATAVINSNFSVSY